MAIATVKLVNKDFSTFFYSRTDQAETARKLLKRGAHTIVG